MIQDVEKERLSYGGNNRINYSLKSPEQAKVLGLPEQIHTQRQILLRLSEMGAFKIEYIPREKKPRSYLGTADFLVDEESTYKLIIGMSYHAVYTELQLKCEDPHSESLRQHKGTLEKHDNNLMLYVAESSFHLARFHSDRKIDALMSYLVNTRPNKEVTLNDLAHSGVTILEAITSIYETIRKAGLKSLPMSIMPVCTKQKVRINTTFSISISEAEMAKKAIAEYRQIYT